jgi:hypothetical protein
MPFELDPEDELDGVVFADAPPDELLLAAPPDELELCVDCVVALVDEPEELEPQAATPRATSTSSAAAKWRGDLAIVLFINRSLVRPGVKSGVIFYDAIRGISFPGTLAGGRPG